MECPFREGKIQCIYWVTGCLHPDPLPIMAPETFAEIKRACDGKLQRGAACEKEAKIK
ncbi:MAG: hypothetical protein PHQ43_12615 [Dehalococcoidales bacterium]|nr:hypothetical protein [Dehalococcoidales bacterium]